MRIYLPGRTPHAECIIGTFVVGSVGDFDGGKATGTWSVIPGSGAGGLAGLHGEGRFEGPHGSKASFSLEFGLG